MVEEIQKFTKLTFLIHLVLGILFTILYWIPEASAPLFGIAYNAEAGAFSMVVGAAAAGLTVSSLLGLMAKEWKEVKITVINEIVWLVGSIIACLINISIIGASAALLIIIVGFLLALFLLTFLQQEEKINPLLK